MKTKLTTKDLITAGAFGAIYLVLLTVLSSVLTIVPILFLATPLIAGIILGTVYMLYATKVPRTGAILVLAILDPGGADYVHGNHLSADFGSCMGINR